MMRPIRLLRCAPLAVAALLANAAPARAQEPAPVRLETFTLDNGLRVVLAPGAGMDAGALVPFADSSAVLLGGSPAGWSRTALARTADGWRWTEETEIAGGLFRQSTEILLAADGTPRTVTQRGSAQGQEMRTELAYAGGRVTGSATTPSPEGPKTVAADAEVPAGVLDENLVPLALRTLPLAAGSEHTLAVFSSAQNGGHAHAAGCRHGAADGARGDVRRVPRGIVRRPRARHLLRRTCPAGW